METTIAGLPTGMEAYLASQPGWSPLTLRTHRVRLGQYVRWNKGREVIDRELFTRYMSDLRQRGADPGGMAAKARTLISYCRFREIDTSKFPPIRPRKKIPFCPTPEQVDAFEASIEMKSRTPIRDLCYSKMLATTGLRLSEMEALRWVQVDFRAKIIHIKGGKGGKDREVPMFDDTVEAFSLWLSASKRNLNQAQSMFCQDRVSPFTHPRSVEKMIDRAASRAGMAALGWHPHSFRHAYVARHVARGVPERIVGLWVGHSSPSTTAKYGRLSAPDITPYLRGRVY